MSSDKLLGVWGEDEAVRYLEKEGLQLLERGFQTRWGEVDAIFKHNDTIIFVEVKTRTYSSDYPAVEAVTPAKQRKLNLAALMYMKKHRLETMSLRYDIVTIEAGKIDWIPNAFDGSPRYTY